MAHELKETIVTPITKMFGIKVPIILAGMNVAAGPALAAAVSNAGGLGVIGGVGYTPAFLKKQIEFLKADLKDQSLPFGIDLLLPQVGGNARKTNYDYTEGNLPDLIDIICQSGAKLFVSAVGVPPKWAVDKLHNAGVIVMNMVGAPKHVQKALDSGVDLICAQGGEGGGHTGDVATSVLIPLCVDACKGARSSLTGQPVYVVAAGGIFDGRGLAMSLTLGAEAVWVGTRFVACTEAGASQVHKEKIVQATVHDTIRTTIYTGRPMRCLKTPFNADWEENKQAEIRDLQSRGIIVVKNYEEKVKKGELPVPSSDVILQIRPWLMGQAAGAIKDVKPAAEIIKEMVSGAVAILKQNSGKVGAASSGARAKL
jgi:NAD(P)H-dependent flavin oxidoreductase YrpB (nitropropane dioxygenase family)